MPFCEFYFCVHAIRWNPTSNNFDDRVFRRLERFFAFSTKAWIVNSKGGQDTLIRRCGIPCRKVFLIKNGVFPNIRFKKEKKENLVITLANFSPRKGLFEFLDVINIILQKDPSIHFLIAGRDDMKGSLQKEIVRRELSLNVKTPGFVKDLLPIFKRAKLMVLPSVLPEGSPTSVLESMSHSIPAIGFNIPGINEVIIDNHTGFLVEPFNRNEMAKKILYVIKSEKEAQRLGRNARNFVRKKHSLKKMLLLHRQVL